jgi:hypothetical protein
LGSGATGLNPQGTTNRLNGFDPQGALGAQTHTASMGKETKQRLKGTCIVILKRQGLPKLISWTHSPCVGEVGQNPLPTRA